MDQEDPATPDVVVQDANHEENSPLIADNSVEISNTAPPKDKFNSVYCVFILVGMTTLLPWNFFISLNNFWDFKFRNVSQLANREKEPPTELQQEFTSYLAIASTIPNATFVIINAIYGQRFSIQKRLSVSLSVMIVAFTIITALAFADTDDWQRTFMIIILSLVVIVNINSAIFQGGSFGMAGKFPGSYMSAQMIGQAIGGVFPALVDIVIVSMDIKEEDAGAVCFVVATVVLALCLLSLFWALKTPFFNFYYQGCSSDDHISPSSEETPQNIWNTLRLSWVYLVSVLLTFTITLTIFPSVTVLVQSETSNSRSPWAVKYFTPVTVFLLFNAGDLIGRSLASWIKMPGRSTLGKCVILIASVARFAFIPLFLNCNIVTEKTSGTQPLFGSDGDFVAFMTLFAVSNGYLGNICMLHGPKATNDKETQESIALVLIAGLVLGTGIGSFLSYPIVSSL